MPLLLPAVLIARSGLWRVARLMAVLAVFVMTIALRAQQYEVDGAIELKLSRPDGSLWKGFHGSFRVYVNGCAWLIQVTETNDWGIPQRREVGTKDGREMFEMVVPYEPISASDPVLFDANAGPPGAHLDFERDGTPDAVYAATGFTNVGALTLPSGFHFTEPGTGFKEVSAVVTAVRPT